MKKTAILLYLALLTGAAAGCESKTPDYTYAGVPFTDVKFTDSFWAPRIKTVNEATIPFAFRKCEETGRIDNFAKAAGLMDGEFIGMRFNDSDVFKIMEGAAYSLSVKYDGQLDNYLDDLIELIAGAQEPDGYLYTIRTINNPLHKAAGAERWSYIRQSHEMYNVGHMYEAAVAHYYATGKRSFLDVAIRNANLLYDTFYVPQRPIVEGHQEVELALVKLYRATKDKRYLDLAQFFLDCRGASPEDGYYFQDHLPVVEQKEAVGHAVRAVYMYMGMADVAALRGNRDYIAAMDTIWNDVVAKKMYITGGIGSLIVGESFGPAYFLPNDKAYCETCAGIANCMWNQRMFALHGDAKYIDVMERSLYNNVLDGISLDGTRFFYPNVLECNVDNIQAQIDAKVAPDKFTAERSEWFDCSCCPSNLARFIPSLPGYVYATHGNALYVNMYGGNDACITLDNGGQISVKQETDYPWNGSIDIVVTGAPKGNVDLMLRIPGWVRGEPIPSDLYRYADSSPLEVSIAVNGEQVSYQVEKGYAKISKKWRAGDRIGMILPMRVNIVEGHPNIESVRGKFAVERGPIVYCVEAVDNPVDDIRTVSASVSDDFTVERSELFGGCATITDLSQNLKFIPYFSRAERGMSQMSVYVNEKE